MPSPYHTRDRQSWQPVSDGRMAAASCGVGWLLVLLKTDEDGCIFLDHVTLLL
jgi:hypothetical protein